MPVLTSGAGDAGPRWHWLCSVPTWHSMVTTDITIADWLEVIRAEGQEIRRLYPFASQVEDFWGSAPLTSEALVTLVEVECLKRARRDAYLPAS